MWFKIKNFLWHNVSPTQTVIKNTFWLGFGQVISRLTRAGIIILAARLLGASGYGIFSYTISLAAIFAIFSDIGINTITTREVTKNGQLSSHYLATALVVKLFLILLTVSLIAILAPHFSKIPEASSLLPWAALLIACESLRDFGFALSRAREKMQLEAGTNILVNFGIVALGVTVLFTSRQPLPLLISYACGTAIGTAILYWWLRNDLINIFGKFQSSLLKPIAKSAWPFALMYAGGTLTLNVDALMIGWFRTTSEVGWYAAAQKPIQLLYMLPTLVAFSVFPTFSRLAHQDNLQLRTLLEKSINFVLILALPLVIGGTLLSDQLISLIYGQDYLASVPVFSILIFTLLLNYPIVLIAQAIFAFDQQKIMVLYSLLAAATNIILNALLIPIWGITAAAFTTLLSQAIQDILVWRKMKQIQNFTFITGIPKILIACVVMAAIVYLLKNLGIPVLINITLAAGIYVATLYMVKQPSIYQLKDLAQKFKSN